MKDKTKPADLKIRVFHSIDQMNLWEKYNNWTKKEKPHVFDLTMSTFLSMPCQYSFVIVVWYIEKKHLSLVN